MGLEYTLGASTLVSATTVRITPEALFMEPGLWVRIDCWTTDCETRTVSSVTQGSGYTDIQFINPLAYAHASGDIIQITADPTASVLHYGATSATSASTNTTAFNRMFAEAFNQSFKATSAPAGLFNVDDELKIPQEVSFEGVGVQTVIAADSTFVGTDEEKAIIHQYRGTTPVEYAAPNVTGKLYLRNFMIDGNNIADVNGLLESQQQPAFRENVRVQNCRGYGIATVDTQQLVTRNTELLNNGRSWVIRTASFLWAYDTNIELTEPAHPTEVNILIEIQPNPDNTGSYSVNFVNLHMEGNTTSGVAIKATGFQGSFENVWLSKITSAHTLYEFHGGSAYDLKWSNIRDYINGSTMVHDIDDDVSLDAFYELRGLMVHYSKGLRQDSPAVGWTFSAYGPKDGTHETSLFLGPHGTVGAAFIRAAVASGLGASVTATTGTGYKAAVDGGMAFQADVDTAGTGVKVALDGGSTGIDVDMADTASIALKTKGGIIETGTKVTASTHTVTAGDTHLRIMNVPCTITLRPKHDAFNAKLVIEDCSGLASPTNPITIATTGNDLINGVNATTTPVNLTVPYVAVDVESDFDQFYLHNRFPGSVIPGGLIGPIDYGLIIDTTNPGTALTLLSEYTPVVFTIPTGTSLVDLGRSVWGRFDFTYAKQVKLTASVISGTGGAYLGFQYSADDAMTWHYFDAANSMPQMHFDGTHQLLAGLWYDIDAGAKNDVYIRVVAYDGAPSDLSISKIEINIR